MAAKKAKPNVKNASAAKLVDSSIENLVSTDTQVNKAVTAISKEVKALGKSIKTLSNKRKALTKKKIAATKKTKKEPSAVNKKAGKTIVREIDINKKESTKLSTKKTILSDELKELRITQKRTSLYIKAVAAADKVLAKPKKKKRKKSRIPAVA